MDAAKELEALKQKKDGLEKKLASFNEKKSEIEKQIVDTRSKITAFDQEIFKRENIIFLTAARQAVEENPAFGELVTAIAESLIFEATALPPSKPSQPKKIGRPRKDTAS